MSWSTVLFSLFLILPLFGLIAVPLFRRLQPTMAGLSVSVARLITLAVMFQYLDGAEHLYRLDVRLASDFGMNGLFEADLRRILYIAVTEMAFMFAHFFASPANAASPDRRISSILSLVLQLLLPLFIFSSNLFVFCTVQLISATVCFFGLRWVGNKNNDSEVEQAAATMMFRYSFLAALLLSWGLAQLGFRGLNLSLAGNSTAEGSMGLAWVWLFCFLFSLPVLPWSRWYGVFVHRGLDVISISTILLAASVTFKLVETGSLSYKDLYPTQTHIIYALGLIGVLMSISEFFASDSLRSYLVALSRFFFSVVAFSLGLSHTGSPAGAMLITTFIPGYMVLALFISSAAALDRFRTVVLMSFLAFLFGIPGSPVYFLYGFIGAKSFSAGIELSVIFGLIWFLYFFSVVHLSKIIFPSFSTSADRRVGSVDTKMSVAFAIFMILGISLICWLFGVRT